MGSQRSHLLIPLVVFVIQVSPSNLSFSSFYDSSQKPLSPSTINLWKPEDVDPFNDEPQPEIAVVRTGEDLDWK